MATPELTRLLTGFQGALVLNPFAPPTAPVLTLTSVSTTTNGTHLVSAAFQLPNGESSLGAAGTIVVTSSNVIQAVFTGTAPTNATALNVYWTPVNATFGATPYFFSTTAITGGSPYNVTVNLSGADATIVAGSKYPQTGTQLIYNGTQFGEIQDVVVMPRRGTKRITGEEYGDETIEVVDIGESWKISCALRGVDPDAYSYVMGVPDSVGVVSGRTLYSYPGTQIANGVFLTQRANLPIQVGLFPKDITRLPSFIFYAAIPSVDESSKLTLQLDREGLMGVSFYAIRANASGQPRNNQILQWGMYEDLSFT
jgi:hypothetical protein